MIRKQGSQTADIISAFDACFFLVNIRNGEELLLKFDERLAFTEIFTDITVVSKCGIPCSIDIGPNIQFREPTTADQGPDYDPSTRVT